MTDKERQAALIELERIVGYIEGKEAFYGTIIGTNIEKSIAIIRHVLTKPEPSKTKKAFDLLEKYWGPNER